MLWFPVIPEQVAAVEAELGVALPSAYKAIVGDARYRQLLAHPTVGAIDLAMSMRDFAAFTAHRRTTLLGFPRTGVVAMEGAGRYIRFWLPDPDAPGTLGGTVYAWDTVEGKQSKDASVLSILQSMLSLVASDPSPARRRAPSPAPFDVEALELPPEGAGWVACGTWTLHGQHVVVTDLGALPSRETLATVRVAPGAYRVEVQRSRSGSDGGDAVIGAVRLVRADIDAAAPLASVHVANVDVDLGAVALYDRQAFTARVRPAGRERFAAALLEVAVPLGLLRIGGATPVLVVRSGEGDGSYGVAALRLGEEVVGVGVGFTE